MKSQSQSQGGFSLIELMVTLAVVAVVVSWAIPSIRQSLARMQVQATASDLRDSINSARATASELTGSVELRPVLVDNNWNAVANDDAVVSLANATNVASADVSLIQDGRASWYAAATIAGVANVKVGDITAVPDAVVVDVTCPVGGGIDSINFDFSGRRVVNVGVPEYVRFVVSAPNTNFRQLVSVQPSGLVSIDTLNGAMPAC